MARSYAAWPLGNQAQRCRAPTGHQDLATQGQGGTDFEPGDRLCSPLASLARAESVQSAKVAQFGTSRNDPGRADGQSR